MRILIIEDDARLAAMLRQGLGEQGFTVDAAHDGAAGLDLALDNDYDAILLDVMLPGKNGFDVLRELRQQGGKAPVLMLTARSSVEDRVQGLDLGADDYLSKPFDFSQLLARVRAITRRPAVEPITVLKVADLEMDPQRREVRRSGALLELTPKELALLEYLLRKKGAVATRSMILDHVWGLDHEGGS
ncbi:MAG: response regulator transcription factor, partial [Vicinamibacteria bacterium]